MFGNDRSQLQTGYRNQKGSGTSYLRNTIRARVYSGNAEIEEKLTQAQLHWKYYNNIHWAKNNDQLLSFNYCRAVIDKVNNFMIGKNGFEINIYDTYGDELPETLEKPFEGLLEYNWRMNKKKNFLHNLLQMGSITGDAYVFVYPDTDKGYVKCTILDTRRVVPTFINGDTSQLKSVRVVKPLGYNEKDYIQKVEEYD